MQVRPEATIAAMIHLADAGARGFFPLDDLRAAWRFDRTAARDIEAQYQFQANGAAA